MLGNNFCKAYPAGRVALLAEVLAPAPRAAAVASSTGEPGNSPGDAAPKLRATGAVLGFELPTTSRWKSLKAQVFTPLLQTLQGAATAMAMIFAPEIAMPLVMAQVVMGSVQTIDDLLERSARGRLETRALVMGFGQLAMNVLPLLGQAQLVGAARRAELALAAEEAAEAAGAAGLTPQASLRAMKAVVAPSRVPMLALAGAEFAGNVLLVSGQTYALLRQLHADDVAAIGDLYVDLHRFAATTHPSDPELKRLQDEIDARAAAVRRRTMQAFTTCVGDQLAMWVPMQMLTVVGPVGPRTKHAAQADAAGDLGMQAGEGGEQAVQHRGVAEHARRVDRDEASESPATPRGRDVHDHERDVTRSGENLTIPQVDHAVAKQEVSKKVVGKTDAQAGSVGTQPRGVGVAAKPRIANSGQYRWSNPRMRDGNFVDAKFKDGTLEVTIKSHGPDELRRSGTRMLDDVFAHFGDANIKKFDGLWVRNKSWDTNFQEYMSNLSNGMTPEAAAWNTWTGRQLKQRGFTRVEVPAHGPDADALAPVFSRE
ncbi:MAG: hypothetical protein R3B48_30690 [Kofleriaceae bacterium]